MSVSRASERRVKCLSVVLDIGGLAVGFAFGFEAGLLEVCDWLWELVKDILTGLGWVPPLQGEVELDWNGGGGFGNLRGLG